jgi:hypothetical protein
MLSGIRPERAGAGFDPVDAEVVGARGFEGIVLKGERLQMEGFGTIGGVVESAGGWPSVLFWR